MTIRILPDQLASQIAAGEVVERPASVVKELLENALDAGASTIHVDIRSGGRDLIQIADNGCGFPATEVETAFLRHATSKIQQSTDLEAIQTLGFRGEALAAIASVSRLTVVTRANGEATGTRLVLHGGIRQSRDQVGAPQGTVMAIENLFYNTPARLKFLKSVTSERKVIDEYVTRYALAYPGVRFRLSHDGRVNFQNQGTGNLQDALLAVYGPETTRELLLIEPDDEDHQVKVFGYVGPPSLHWANRGQIMLFVNGRPVKDTQLTYAIIQAYHTLLPTGRYPMSVLFVTLPYEQVDVNVHPTKTEIRFRQGVSVFSAVQRAVRKTLLAGTPVRAAGGWERPQTEAYAYWQGEAHAAAFSPTPQHALDLDWGAPPPLPETIPDWTNADTEDRPEPVAFRPPQQPITPGGPQPSALGGNRLPIMRVVGQIGAAYIITEGPDGMFLIDQHAAHERILYEQFLAAWERANGQSPLPSQGLVTGVAVHLIPSQATLLADHLDTLVQLGFQVEPFGPNTFMVRALPALLRQIDPAQALQAIVADLEQGDKPLQDKIEARIIRRVCKTAAIKAGQTLSPQEMDALIRQLETCHNPHTCPHGRPTLIHLSVAQLAKEFGRI
ncbi:MAG: DNA mismatch repair endonuclease MutL [Chloroflexi bacterium]|nr:DNA mismatch repair endonuclease MutL [Chloroflexota bacterium]MBP8056269.1 DNA mismatch repair endonuclease MutL [Chloroflexota bacterium]